MFRSLRIVALATASLLAIAPAAVRAAASEARASQPPKTPDDALRRLLEGNERFASGVAVRRDLLQGVAATRDGQTPFAAVLGCIDSRVPPELVFDTGIGDIFVTRTAGNVLDETILGGLEFATHVAGAGLIVVLGHTACGAVRGACDGVQLGHLTDTLALIRPALAASESVPGPHDASNDAYVGHVTEANVRLTARRLADESPILRERIREGRLRIVPALYDVATGRVSLLD